MKKCLKISIILLIIMLICFFITKVYASSGLDNAIKGGDDFLSKSNPNSTTIKENTIRSESFNIFNVVSTIGIIASVLVVTLLGLKMMISSVEEKAKIKEKLLPALIGCIIIFGAFVIWKIVINVLQSV